MDPRLSFDELDVQRNGHFVANEDGASFKGRVPSKAKVFPVDPRHGGELNARVPPRIFLRRA
jgi:hypothetical protein